MTAVVINGQIDITQYVSVDVFLKSGSVPKITVPGKLVSVNTDGYNISIQTETNYAAFDAGDVIALRFEK